MGLWNTVFRDHEIIHPAIDNTVDGLAEYLIPSLGAIIAYVGISTGVSTAYVATVRGGSPGGPIGVQFLASGIGLLVAMAVVWWWLDEGDRTRAFPFRAPSAAEVGWALVFVPLGIAAFTLGTEGMSVLGFDYQAFEYDLTNPVTVAGVLVAPLFLSPIIEEVLFRGLLLGSLIDRGWSPWTAGFLTILIFASLHIWLGIAGVVGISAMAVFPTILRLRFNNLTGATVQHFLNNVYAYVGTVVLTL